jgi:hypothetical protein
MTQALYAHMNNKRKIKKKKIKLAKKKKKKNKTRTVNIRGAGRQSKRKPGLEWWRLEEQKGSYPRAAWG